MCEAPSVVAVGVNCLPPKLVAPILQVSSPCPACSLHMHLLTEPAVQCLSEAQDTKPAGSRKLLLAYPNSGEEWDAGARDWKGTSGLVSFAQDAVCWADSGASLIGGCCRTTPGHIQAVAEALAGT